MARYFMEGTRLAGWELMRDAPTEPGRQGPQMGGVSC